MSDGREYHIVEFQVLSVCPLEYFSTTDKARLLLTLVTMMLTNVDPNANEPEEVMNLTTESELQLTEMCLTFLLLLLDGPTEFDLFSFLDGSPTLNWMMGFFSMQLFKVLLLPCSNSWFHSARNTYWPGRHDDLKPGRITYWSNHTRAKAMSLHWFLLLASLPATPSESDFAHDVIGNWVQNPFCRDFTSEIAFAFALVWLDHKTFYPLWY